MATTHLGKIKRVDRIRNAIYDELMEGMMNKNINSHIFLDREILFYTLLNHSVSEEEALYCTTKIYGEGKQVVSRGLKETFACTSNELGQKQFTKFISKFMKSGRIELLDNSPYTWRMNGFSTFEEPYIEGYKLGKSFLKERLKKEKKEQERLEQERLEQERLEQELLERERLEQERLEKIEKLKKIKRNKIKNINIKIQKINNELQKINNKILNNQIEPESIKRRNNLVEKKKRLQHRLLFEV